jgi:hypothetical protein
MSESFLSYLTVFRSRICICKLVIDVTDLTKQSNQRLERKIRAVLESREELDLDLNSNFKVFEHLQSKRLISSDGREKGRYSGLTLQLKDGSWQATSKNGSPTSTLAVYQVDDWMSDHRLASTVGAPTPDNYNELIELAYQLNILSKSKNTWTSSGILISQLQALAPGSYSSHNPFVIGPEGPAFVRQVISADGIVIRELLREICDSGSPIKRDEIARRLPEIVDRAIAFAKQGRLGPAELRELKKHSRILHATAKNREGASKAPGVLEHRISPRLEWLTDFGYLSKEGLPKNGFEYSVQPFAHEALTELDNLIGNTDWADSFAAWDWFHNPVWKECRELVSKYDGKDRFVKAYELLQRRIGPSPIRDVAFAATLFSTRPLTFRESVDQLIDFANVTDGASLSGGRYVRSPENIYLPNRNSRGI